MQNFDFKRVFFKKKSLPRALGVPSRTPRPPPDLMSSFIEGSLARSSKAHQLVFRVILLHFSARVGVVSQSVTLLDDEKPCRMLWNKSWSEGFT